MKKIKTIFAGTPKTAIYLLESILKKKKLFEIQVVLTQPDKKKERGRILHPSPIKEFAFEKNIPTLTPDNLRDDKLTKTISNLNPNVIIVANYSKQIPQEILDIPKHGTICFHPSLLPKYRGTTPIQTAILNNDKETGISFFLMDDKFDHGPILYQEKSKIFEKDNNKTLEHRLYQLGAKKLPKIISRLIAGKTKPQTQNHQKTSYTKMLTRKNGYFSIKDRPELIWRKYKAYYPWPGIWTIWKKKRLKITNLNFINGKISINKLQLEGKKEVGLKEFKNGHPSFNLFTEK